MNSHHILLIVHLICAAIWVGGHLFMAIRIIPKAIKENNTSEIRNFKERYERLGMPSLIILVITGVWMTYDYNVTFSTWFSFSNGIERVISIKLILLFCTIICALIAELIVFPKYLEKNIKLAVIPMILVTLIGVAMLVLGSFVRFGGIY